MTLQTFLSFLPELTEKTLWNEAAKERWEIDVGAQIKYDVRRCDDAEVFVSWPSILSMSWRKILTAKVIYLEGCDCSFNYSWHEGDHPT